MDRQRLGATKTIVAKMARLGFGLLLMMLGLWMVTAVVGVSRGDDDLLELSRIFLLISGPTLILIGIVQWRRNRPLPLTRIRPLATVGIVAVSLIIGLSLTIDETAKPEMVEEILREPVITDLVEGGNKRIRAENMHLGDLRTWGHARFIINNVDGDHEFWVFADEVQANITNSVDFTPLFHGQSYGRISRSTFTALQAYGQSRIELVDSSAGYGNDVPEASVGNTAMVDWRGGTVKGRTLVFDWAKLALSKTDLDPKAEIAALGNSLLVIEEVNDPSHGVLYLFDQAQAVIRNSQLDTIYVDDQARVTLENSTVGKLYFAVTVNGEAKIRAGQIVSGKDQVVVPHITVDHTSTVDRQAIGRIEVAPKGILRLIDTDLGSPRTGVYVWGNARLENSRVEHLFAYGQQADLTLNRSTVAHFYQAVFADTGTVTVHDGEVDGTFNLTKVNNLQSTIRQQHLGAVFVDGTAQAIVEHSGLERIVVAGQAQAQISDSITQKAVVQDQAQAELVRVVYTFPFDQPMPVTASDLFIHRLDEPDLAKQENYPIYAWTPGQAPLTGSLELPLEVRGRAVVEVDRGAEEVRVSDQARLTVTTRPRQLVNHIVGRDRAQITLYGYPRFPDFPGSYSTILLDRAVMRAFNGPPGMSHVLVLDDAMLYEQTTSNQEVMLGPSSGSSDHSPANPIVIHVAKLPDHFPGAGSSIEMFTDKPTLDGVVFVAVWSMTNFTRPVRHYAGLLLDDSWSWPQVEVLVDDQPLPEAEKASVDWPVLRWDTATVTDGEHILTVRIKNAQQTVEKQVVVRVKNS